MILPKVMFALRDAIVAQGFDWPASVRAGISRGPIDDETVEPESVAPDSNRLPSIVCNADSARQIHPQVATFEAQCAVTVSHQADDTEPLLHLTQSAQVGDWIHGETFIQDVSQYTGFTAFGRGAVDHQFSREGRRWVTTFNFTLSAAPSDIT
jgi:hypothetical protein